MTDSQLPTAATAQKFGTLIPNRIFGEFHFLTFAKIKQKFLRLTTNCILSFPFIFILLHKQKSGIIVKMFVCCEMISSWWNKVINQLTIFFYIWVILWVKRSGFLVCWLWQILEIKLFWIILVMSEILGTYSDKKVFFAIFLVHSYKS